MVEYTLLEMQIYTLWEMQIICAVWICFGIFCARYLIWKKEIIIGTKQTKK